jgi:hypothetical protein
MGLSMFQTSNVETLHHSQRKQKELDKNIHIDRLADLLTKRMKNDSCVAPARQYPAAPRPGDRTVRTSSPPPFSQRSVLCPRPVRERAFFNRLSATPFL